MSAVAADLLTRCLHVRRFAERLWAVSPALRAAVEGDMLNFCPREGKSGRELADRLASERPAIKVLYISGVNRTGLSYRAGAWNPRASVAL